MRNGYLYVRCASARLVSADESNVCCVFGADEVKAISANVGEDVILETDEADVLGADELSWKIQGEIGFIAEFDKEANKVSIDRNDKRFSGRLLLNEKTGSLTIKNVNTADTRMYELQINSRSGIKTKTFSLTVHSEVGIVEVSVMEGDSVTLNINDIEVQKDEELSWKVKPKDENVFKSINDERFKKGKTGSLTITNINIKDGGLYRLESSSSTSIDIKYKARFNVAVHDGVKSVSVMEGDTITLHTGVAQILTACLNSTGARWSNINLNNETGEITIKNIRGDQSGDLEVEINTTIVTLHRKLSINISDSGLSSGVVAGIVVCVLVVLLFAAALGVIYYRRRISHLQKQSLSKTAHDLSNMASVYLVDVDTVYTRYFDISFIPSTVFFFNGQHMKVA
ncbi:Thioredoxin-like protein 4B [Anabarilius grahami]|uniref:Thioredoxin-like protein 4B n=1 Tax=Anabarilius grahami TaxID=495550 RepID=A0A3N0Y9D4_ANAGA|nr:Thioredoxin-like protein 4B [Anabarilius grahami]